MTVLDLLEMIDKHSDSNAVNCFLCGINWANEINGLLLAEFLDIDEAIAIIGHLPLDSVDWIIETTEDGQLQIGFLLRNKEG